MISALSAINPLQKRWTHILRLRKDIYAYRTKVTEGEQPFGRLNDMMESISIQRGEARSTNTQAFHEYHTVLQVKPQIMATSLSLQCDILILNDFLELRRLQAQAFMSKHDWRSVDIKIDFTRIREDCMNLAAEAEARSYRMTNVEAYLYFARLVALERRSIPADKIKEDGTSMAD